MKKSFHHHDEVKGAVNFDIELIFLILIMASLIFSRILPSPAMYMEHEIVKSKTNDNNLHSIGFSPRSITGNIPHHARKFMAESVMKKIVDDSHLLSKKSDDKESTRRHLSLFSTDSQVIRDANLSRGPITIIGNDGFRELARREGWKGNGTRDDPYVIEAISIVSTNDTYLFYIANTTVHFILRNCYFGAPEMREARGIYLVNVSNAVLVNDTFKYLEVAVELFNSHEISLSNLFLENIGFTAIYSKHSTNLLVESSLINTSAIGIRFRDASNVTVRGNVVTHFENAAGLLATATTNLTIVNNTFSEGHSAILRLQHSRDINITDNIFDSSAELKFFLDAEHLTNLYLSRNVITKRDLMGNILKSNHVTFRNNFISAVLSFQDSDILNVNENIFTDNGVLKFFNGSVIAVVNNTFQNVAGSALQFSVSMSISVLNNTFKRSSSMGLEMISSNDSLIQGNTFIMARASAISLARDVSDVQVLRNNFFDNHRLNNESQVITFSENVTFMYNFWSDWRSPDADGDGVVDVPYSINGKTVIDPYPMVMWYPLEQHVLTRPCIIFPLPSISYGSQVNITWKPSLDTKHHPIKYHVFYSDDGGFGWRQLAANLVTSSYLWNTSSIEFGTFLIKVVAEDELGFQAERQLSGTIVVRNPRMTVPRPVLTTTTDDSLTRSMNLLSIRIFGFRSLSSIFGMLFIIYWSFREGKISKMKTKTKKVKKFS